MAIEGLRCSNRDDVRSQKSASGGTMLAAIGAVLLVLWLLGFLAFHVTTGAVHILLVLAVIFVVMHFFRGRGVTV
jgi:membrane-bound ClpP family serine protease